MPAASSPQDSPTMPTLAPGAMSCDPTMGPVTRLFRDIAEYLGLVEEHQLRSLDDEAIAKAFHDAYERLAPEHGYQTRVESRTPWEFVPINNRELVTATVRALLDARVIYRGDAETTCTCGSGR